MSNSFTLHRSDLVRTGACPFGLDIFDIIAKSQGTIADATLPDGWTEVHSVLLYQWNPQVLIFLTRHGLVPNHNISRKIPFLYHRSMLPNE
jgi:hypothetical protein